MKPLAKPQKSLENCNCSKKKSHPQILFPSGDPSKLIFPVAWNLTCPATATKLNITGQMRNTCTSWNQWRHRLSVQCLKTIAISYVSTGTCRTVLSQLLIWNHRERRNMAPQVKITTPSGLLAAPEVHFSNHPFVDFLRVLIKVNHGLFCFDLFSFNYWYLTFFIKNIYRLLAGVDDHWSTMLCSISCFVWFDHVALENESFLIN